MIFSFSSFIALYKNNTRGKNMGAFVFFLFFLKFFTCIEILEWRVYTNLKEHFLLKFLCALLVTTSCAAPFHRYHLSPLAQSGAQCTSRTHLWEWDLQIPRSDTLTTQALVPSRFCFKHPQPTRLLNSWFFFFDTLDLDQLLWYVLAQGDTNTFHFVLISVAARNDGPSQVWERVECTVTRRTSLKTLRVPGGSEERVLAFPTHRCNVQW